MFASIGAKVRERGGKEITDHSSSWTTRSHTSQGTSLLAYKEKICESNNKMKCIGLSYHLLCLECAFEFWEDLWSQEIVDLTCSKGWMFIKLGATKVSFPRPLLHN